MALKKIRRTQSVPLDFTLETYKLLMNAMRDYEVLTVRQYLEKRPKSGFIVLRHDVDRFPNNALRMARLEASRDVYSTYYFRVGKRIDEDYIKKISDIGHEIGYHYEVLSKTNGDYDRALKLFEAELGSLRSIYDVRTISMDGKPFSKWDNSLLWGQHSFEKYSIIGDGKLSIVNVPYFTDAGRSWNGSNNIRDLPIEKQDTVKIESTHQLIELVNSRRYDSYYLNMHPERWANSTMEYCTSLTFDNLVNAVKKVYASRN